MIMRERKTMITLIKGGHKHLKDEFILGRISGIGYCMSGFERGYVIMHVEEGSIYKRKFTEEEYEEFSKVIEELYPGLCEFNYEINWESI